MDFPQILATGTYKKNLANQAQKWPIRDATKASTIQCGYRECGTHARVFSHHSRTETARMK